MMHGKTFTAEQLGTLGSSSIVVIFGRAGHVLAVSRKDNLSHWSLPGGKRARGETAAETALRELAEETSLRACSLVPVFSAPSGDGSLSITTAFLCTAEGEPRAVEGGHVGYLQPESLCNRDVSPFYNYYRLLFAAIKDLP